MNLTGFRTAFRTRMGLPDADSFYTSTVIDELVNAALQFVSSEQDWAWLEKSETLTTVASTSSYSAASDYLRTITVADSTGIPLSLKPIDELEFMTTAESANPRFYAVYAGAVHLRPVPNGAFSVFHRYIGSEDALVGTTDTPLMPAQFHEVVVEYACYLARMRAGNIAEAEAALTVYDRWVAVMKARANRFAESRGGGVSVEPAPPAA